MPAFLHNAMVVLAGSSLMFGAVGCADEPDMDHVTWLAFRAEKVRELSFLYDVPVHSITQEAYLANVQAEANARDDAELAELAATYGRLGFFPLDADLHAIFGQSSDWVGAYYATDTKEIVLVGDAPDSRIVHEFVHGLQDQHFDLGALSENATTSDALLAKSAVVEGDAELAEGRFVMQDNYGLDVDLNQVDWARLFDDVRRSRDELLAESQVPLLFMAYPSFAYSAGLEYCAHNLTGVSAASPIVTERFPFRWSKEDALFSNPPKTTEQILLLDQQDALVGIGIDDVPGSMTAQLERIDTDVLGQWLTYLLLYPLDGASGIGHVLTLAKAWDGDRVLFVHDLQQESIGVVWASVWDDSDAATRMETALWRLHGASVVDNAEPRLGQADDGEAVWIERRTERVVVVKNITQDLMAGLADAALSTSVQPMRLMNRPGVSLPLQLVKHIPTRAGIGIGEIGIGVSFRGHSR